MTQLNLSLETPLSEVEIKRKEILGEEWFHVLREVLNSPAVRKVATHVGQRRKETVVYPEQKDTFKAFQLTPYKQVKLVILGQDPYYNGLADGLAFSTNSSTETPKSLELIFKAIRDSTKAFPVTPNLTKWATQGVLLLNTVLTVEKDKPNSHKGLGWEELTSTALRALSKRDAPICFMLWGAEAREMKRWITNPKHLILEREHPAAALYQNRDWNHSDCFVKCNEYLVANGVEPVIWNMVNDDLPF